MLYLWEVGRLDAASAEERYWAVVADEAPALPDPARVFARRLALGTIAHVADLDAAIESRAQNWRLSRMAVIDRLILRLGAYELLHERETPAGVVIDEALELARTFSEEEAVRFVNGILDAIHRHQT